MKKIPDIILVICMFILMSCGGKGREMKEAARRADSTALAQTDYNISRARINIDSLRGRIPSYGLDSMMRHPQCKDIIENQPIIDSLVHVNDSLMTCACAIANRHSQVSVVRPTPKLFNEFGHISEVRRIGWRYWPNYTTIQKFNKRKAAAYGLTRDIQNHCDSVVLSKMYTAQLQLDSLLTQKHKMLHANQK